MWRDSDRRAHATHAREAATSAMLFVVKPDVFWDPHGLNAQALGRVLYAGLVRPRSGVRGNRLQDVTRLSPDEIERVLTNFVEDRDADYFERRGRGLAIDVSPMTFILSQGFKVGLTWRDVPLGKTCWDIAIYQRLIQDLKPRTLIELGTGLGGSALFFYDTAALSVIPRRRQDVV